MTEITLIKADGNLLPLNSKEPLRQVKSAVMKEERMGEDTLTLVVEATLPIDFTVGDTLQALGKTYYLNTGDWLRHDSFASFDGTRLCLAGKNIRTGL